MWLLTPVGFFSIVQKPGDEKADTLTIRSRAKGDLYALRLHYLPSLGEVIANAGTDYRFRASAPRADIAQVMSKLITDINYDNFKNEVTKRQGKARAQTYHKVWDSLFDITEPELVDTSLKPDPKTRSLAQAYGGALIDELDQILLIKPRNELYGYVWTFPKGRPKKGELPEAAALREVLEETGYAATVAHQIPGNFAGEATVTDYFLMRCRGEAKPFGPETEEVKWATMDEAEHLIQMTRNAVGRERDLSVLRKARHEISLAIRQHQAGNHEF
jgi:ADP-ribose pyrophosphatase YjhB (NUDIX family)